MAGLLDLLSGRSGDIYGAGLLTPEQRGGIGNIGLLALAGKLGQLAGPSFSPVPDFGAALGQAAGAYGASQEGAGTAALNAILTGQKGRKLQSELDYAKESGPYFDKIIQALSGLGGPGGVSGGTPGSGSTGGGAAAPLGAGGGGGGDVGSLSDPRGVVPHIQAEAARLGIDPTVALKVARSEGLGTFYGDGGKSGGAFQLYTGGGMGNDFQRDTGLNPLDPKNEKATITYALEQAAQKGWGAWNGAKKLGITGFAGIGKPGAAPTAAAPAGGGGLLNLPDPGGIGARAGFALPQSGGGRGPIDDPYAGTDTPRGPAGSLGPSGPQGEVVVPIPPRPAPPPLAIPNLPPQAADAVAQLLSGGAGGRLSDVGQLIGPGPVNAAIPTLRQPGPVNAAIGTVPAEQAGGLLMPGGGLLPRGAGPIPGMPPAGASPDVMPSDDPRLQLGPLAPAPAPAAAAPAAAVPGLLSPGALPGTAPATPRGVNPAYGQVATAIAAAALQASRAGMPTAPFDLLLRSLESNPAYKAEIKRGEEAVGLEYAGPKAEAAKAVELRYAQAIAEATSRGNLPSQIIIKTIEAQNDLRNRMAALGLEVTFDKDGNGTTRTMKGADEAATARKAAEGRGEGENVLVPAMRQGPNGPYKVQIPRTQYIDELNRGTVAPASDTPPGLGTPAAPRSAAGLGGVAAPGTAPVGGLVGEPYVSKEEEQSREIDLKTLESKRVGAESARLAIQNANDSRDLVEKGVVMGPGESVRSGLLKLGYALKLTGKDENDLIANTEAFISRQGAELKDALKGLGPPISNIDVQTAGSIAGGKNVTVQGYLELMKIKEKYNRQALTEYNDMAAQAPPSRFDRTVKEPPTYGAKTATGPNGQRMWEKSPGNWVAF